MFFCQSFLGVDPPTCTWQIWIPLFFSSSSHPRILSVNVIAKENTVLDWTFTCLNNASAPKGLSSTKISQNSLCVFSQLHCSWAVFIFCPRPPHDLCHLVFPAFPLTLDFGTFLIRQAFRLHLLVQVPKTSFLSPLPWRLPGVCRQTAAAGRARKNDGPDSTRHTTRGYDGSAECSQADEVRQFYSKTIRTRAMTSKKSSRWSSQNWQSNTDGRQGSSLPEVAKALKNNGPKKRSKVHEVERDHKRPL